jgi:hypothetical protein
MPGPDTFRWALSLFGDVARSDTRAIADERSGNKQDFAQKKQQRCSNPWQARRIQTT